MRRRGQVQGDRNRERIRAETGIAAGSGSLTISLSSPWRQIKYEIKKPVAFSLLANDPGWGEMRLAEYRPIQ